MAEFESGYDWYLENKRKYVEKHLDDVAIVNASEDIPQHILWAKSVSDKLIDAKSKYVGKGETFGFSESLVNKLSTHRFYLLCYMITRI